MDLGWALTIRLSSGGGAGLALIVTMASADLDESAWLVAVTITRSSLATIAGAVYSPVAEMLPVFGVSDHDTRELALPFTVALNCCVWPAPNVAERGETLILKGVRLMTAVADLVGSATLVAVTVTCWEPPTTAGAVYNPVPEIAPTPGRIAQLTAVLPVPVTAAVNCCVWPPPNTAVAGDMVTPTAASETLALADFDGSSTLVAVTVICCGLATTAGAVYSPLVEILPTFGFTDQMTAVLAVPLIVAANC